ncbi:MAG: EscU/YscU/HrcU family type III secretion system export apparatus switch protein [Rhodocyclaceae bacterium]
MAEDLDKNLAATPYKLEQARKRGSVAKSADLVSLVVFVVAVVFLASQGEQVLTGLYANCRVILAHAFELDASGTTSVMREAGQLSAILLDILLPALLVIVIGAVVGNVIQTGLMFTVEPVKPDWTRLNPSKGFKKLFSLRSVFDGFRSFIKLAILGMVLYVSLRDQIPIFFRLSQLDSHGYLSVVIRSLAGVGFKMAIALAALTAIDVLYTRREFAKQMRMSHKEHKDEHKQREGDPRVRSKLRTLRMEFLAKTRALANVRRADVVITNPTHLAIALRYEHGVMESPQILAKGAGSMAAAIRRIARLHRVPVVENRPLARRLFQELTIGAYVTPALYADVARIIVWIFAMRRGGEARA